MVKREHIYRQGYAVLIVGVLFAVGMAVISTQIARQTITLQRSVGDSLEETVVGGYMDGVASKILDRSMLAGSGYYEVGKLLRASIPEVELRQSLELSALANGQTEQVRDNDLRFDYIAASIVPVPTAYDFGNQLPSNGLVNPEIIPNDINMGVLSPSNQPDLGFYNTTNGMENCDPDVNVKGGEGYNIFKRAKGGQDFAAVLTPNYLCGNVKIDQRDILDSKNRTGSQKVVVVSDKVSESERPNFYYTVPNLGTGSAGRDCEPHKVYFEETWNGTDEVIDPLDHPCNWNIVQKGDGFKFGLSSFNDVEVQSELRVKTSSGLAFNGTNLVNDLDAISGGQFFDGVGEDDVLLVRIRLRCSDGGSYCDPLDRMEFYDNDFLNEFSASTHAECSDENGTQLCAVPHTYKELAKFNLENPSSDFTKLAFSYGIYDNGRFLPMRNDWNRVGRLEDRLGSNGLLNYKYNNSLLLGLSRNNQYTVFGVDNLRSYGEFSKYLASFNMLQTKIDRNNNFGKVKLNEYDNQKRISTFAINNLEFPYQEQGFITDYTNDYYHLYLLKDDLERPEFVLKSLNDFIEVMNRKNMGNGNYRPITYDHFEYQIVSSKIVGTEKGYVIYDYGTGAKLKEKDFNLQQITEAGFINVSN